jgi:putative membrane protein
MNLVSDVEQKGVADAIAAAERETSGEIVAVIAPASGRYLYVPFLWAGLAALIVPLPLIYWTWMPVQQIYLIQVGTFFALLVMLMLPRIRLVLVSRKEKHRRAHRRAIEQFLTQNLRTTPGRTGVLIYISVAERFAEILADEAIHKHVSEARWRAIIDDLTNHIGRAKACEGLIRAIGAVGKLLAEHFPPGPTEAYSLPNHLIVLPPEEKTVSRGR